MKAALGRLIVAVAMFFLLAGARVEAVTLTLQAKHNISNNFSPEFYEASGLGLAKNGTKLWSVGDENNFTMYKMELDGTAASDTTIGPASGVAAIQNASFEGVTYAPPPPGITDDHHIYLVDENSTSVVPVNYNTNEHRAPVALSSMIGYSNLVCQGGTQTVQQAFSQSDNTGLEGITWNADLSSFFLLKEKSPGLLIRVSADLRSIQGCKTLTYNGADYSDVAYDASRKKFWIVSDEGRSVSLYDWGSASEVQRLDLPFDNGEGVAYDPATSQLFIVTDNGDLQTSYLYIYKVQ
jgi:hypothetical protein